LQHLAATIRRTFAASLAVRPGDLQHIHTAQSAAAAVKATVQVAFIDAGARQLCSLADFINAAQPAPTA